MFFLDQTNNQREYEILDSILRLDNLLKFELVNEICTIEGDLEIVVMGKWLTILSWEISGVLVLIEVFQ